jgi:ribonuclease P protein component
MAIRFISNGRDHDRVGISTGRRLGGAVVRNTVRRRIRAILRASDALVRAPGPVSGGRDLLIVARPASADATFQELQASLVSLLRSIPVSRPDPIP